jgi:four helix bundle protein
MTLKIYSFILETLRVLGPVIKEIGRHDVDLARQMRRAAASVALNTSEACGNDGGHRRERFRTAQGSAKETRSCIEVGVALGYIVEDADVIDRLDRIAATLHKLGH